MKQQHINKSVNNCFTEQNNQRKTNFASHPLLKWMVAPRILSFKTSFLSLIGLFLQGSAVKQLIILLIHQSFPQYLRFNNSS
ncbi:hypothetical protein CDL12_29894 [Handroanthus impetiginosus]|uniref:Uncharacterized protein n=1 Tax=Handroanthus impetiginosus TaxID=429701 RepID=A0A2G9FX49_9LAMI|nr:hypothetical protein CDL12_29894 [Handroanthus impetiginosus]